MSELEDKLNMILSDPESLDQIMKLAQSFSSGQQEHSDEHESGGGIGDIAGDLGDLGFDMKKMLEFVSKTNISSNSKYSSLLTALKPYLRKERQDKLDRAIRISKLSRLAKSAVENGLIGEL